MSFFRIDYPPSSSDYDFSFINGSLWHPFGLPGVKCSVCGETWGGSRILPYECPASLRRLKEVNDRWPVTDAQHKELQGNVRRELRHEGITLEKLQPGDDFQPAYLEVPSRPEADFLWGSIGSVVVSERVKKLLSDFQHSDVVFCEVKLKKVGTKEAILPAPVPSTGEPADLIDELPTTSDPLGIGPYHEMVVLKESGYPPGYKPGNSCSGCGRDDGDGSNREFRMAPNMWNGDSIFFLKTTLYIVVTEAVKTILEDADATNVVFHPL